MKTPTLLRFEANNGRTVFLWSSVGLVGCPCATWWSFLAQESCLYEAIDLFLDRTLERFVYIYIKIWHPCIYIYIYRRCEWISVVEKETWVFGSFTPHKSNYVILWAYENPSIEFLNFLAFSKTKLLQFEFPSLSLIN